jgi:hypothetical protein
MTKLKDMCMVDFVEEVLGMGLTHAQQVAIELYEDVKLKENQGSKVSFGMDMGSEWSKGVLEKLKVYDCDIYTD